jgi:hypothetical protein
LRADDDTFDTAGGDHLNTKVSPYKSSYLLGLSHLPIHFETKKGNK